MNKVEWFYTSEKQATRSDADCEGKIWTWQEYFGENEETGERMSVGFFVRRDYWKDCCIGCNMRFAPKMWARTGFQKVQPPNGLKEGIQSASKPDAGEGK